MKPIPLGSSPLLSSALCAAAVTQCLALLCRLPRAQPAAGTCRYAAAAAAAAVGTAADTKQLDTRPFFFFLSILR